MINSISISSLASYTSPVSFSPNWVNYFFGSNGSGKTTISKLVAEPAKYTECSVYWGEVETETLVYNKDFVKDNFGQDADIKGIFTLGRASKEAKDEIERLKKGFDEKKDQYDGLRKSSSDTKQKLTDLNAGIEESCWKTKKRYEKTFPDLWKGVGYKRTFLDRCIQELNNQSELYPIEELKDQYANLFQSELKFHPLISNFDYSQLTIYESSELLQKSVVGKEDVDVGALVKKLGKESVNSYLSEQGSCPFCLQSLPNSFKESIDLFFDETYERECKAFEQFARNYMGYLDGKLEELRRTTAIQSELISFHELELKIEAINQKISSIKGLIESKITTPSEKIYLQTVEDDFAEVEKLLATYREVIQKNNITVNNLKEEQKRLKSQIWRFLSNEVKDDISAFQKSKSGLENALDHITEKAKSKKAECDRLESKLKTKESEVTSVVHTVNEINKTLKLLNFYNFSLVEAEQKGSYRIVREDGSECRDSLSEGEYNFITFLYFYQLLKGSVEESGLTRDKVVVIDDPIQVLIAVFFLW